MYLSHICIFQCELTSKCTLNAMHITWSNRTHTFSAVIYRSHMITASIRHMASHDWHMYLHTYVHCTVCCYSTGSFCHSLLHPEGWRGWMASPSCAIQMTQSPLWHQVRRMWWVGGAPESAESDQGGSPGDRIFTKHLNTDWQLFIKIMNDVYTRQMMIIVGVSLRATA